MTEGHKTRQGEGKPRQRRCQHISTGEGVTGRPRASGAKEPAREWTAGGWAGRAAEASGGRVLGGRAQGPSLRPASLSQPGYRLVTLWAAVVRSARPLASCLALSCNLPRRLPLASLARPPSPLGFALRCSPLGDSASVWLGATQVSVKSVAEKKEKTERNVSEKDVRYWWSLVLKISDKHAFARDGRS